MDMTQGCSPISGVPSNTKEGTLQYRAGTTYLGKEQWKSCYLVLRYGQVKHISCYEYVPLNILTPAVEASDYININMSPFLLAVMGSCTCMQNELMLHLFCQSQSGKFS